MLNSERKISETRMGDETDPGKDSGELSIDPSTTRQARIDALTEKAIEIVERAMDDDDPEFATQTALALLRIVKGGGIGGTTRKDPSGTGSGNDDDPGGEVDLSDENVLVRARERFERENR